MKNKKRIGLILNAPVSYSQTFLANEIRVWQDAGFDVVLFIKYHPKKHSSLVFIKTYEGLPLPNELNGQNAWLMMSGLTKLFLVGLFAAIRFMKHERSSGTSLLETIKKIYFYAHIFPVRVDFIHFGFGNIAVHGEFLAKSMNAQMSISLRGSDISIFPLDKPQVYQRVWENVDKVHVISNDLYQEAVRYGLKKDVNVYPIHQTLDLSKIPFSVIGTEIHTPIRIVTVARLHWKKGIEYMLSAVKELKVQGIDCLYTIAGSGEHESAIRYTIAELGIEDRVCLKGALSYTEVMALMSVSDFYVQSSIQEGFCNAVLEAQAAGLLTISSDAEGINENVIDGFTGWIVPKRNPMALVEKIKEVLLLPAETTQRIKENARKRVEQDFFLDRYKEEWILFFSDNP